MKKTWLMFLLVAFMVPTMIGCNTSDGIGEDLEEVGDNIKDATN